VIGLVEEASVDELGVINEVQGRGDGGCRHPALLGLGDDVVLGEA
jgi:hypothetical protein